VAGYGPRILALLEDGATPAEAIERALEADELRERRQLGVVSAEGESASFTGSECNDWAGDAQGLGYAAQGNILAGEAVVQGMASAFEQASGSLAERLMAALETAESAGGDRRGRQSAALLVERTGADEGPEGIDTIVDLRVDDHPEPIEELRRLLGIHAVQEERRRATVFYNHKEYERAVELLEGARERFPDDPLLLYDLACFESLAGRLEGALAHLGHALALDPTLRESVRADDDFVPIRDDPRWGSLIGG
jgi:uncharacterized Ntn-hydrolase superfamily protein